MARDITEEWHARKQLEESEERYRDLVEKAGIAILVDDAEGRITFFNQRFVELLGYTEDEIRSMSIQDFIHPEDRGPVMAIHRAHLAGESAPWKYRFRALRRDARVLRLAVDVTPLVRDGVITGTRSYIRDVTEEELLQAQLLQAQKMESVGRLAGGVAHDFNNILQAILAHADMASRGLRDAPELEEHLREIRTSAERAADLTRQLLAFSRSEDLRLSILDLNDLVAHMLNMIRRVIGEDMEVVYEPGGGMPPIEGDAGQLEQVLLNLAVNARDAMPGGGRLVISTSSEPPHRRGESPRVALRVSDTGSGMDKATRERIFEPFFTTKEQGTGLGLATVYGIVQRHGGTIEVESEPGRGTTFTVFLPAAAGPSGEPERPERPHPHGGTETILVAEDDPSVRRVLKGILQGAGYTVVEAEDGEQAVELFSAEPGQIDLALLDALMPHMDGPEAAERMRQIRPGLPILFSSGYSGDALGRGHPIPPDAEIIQKPYSISQLLTTVREVLDGGA
ncbi:MAG TPA: PAS domain S-box protein [Acidobacteria bacterium]|nr:PAS domain S-box protein [Acidobacteriota bacterium]